MTFLRMLLLSGLGLPFLLINDGGRSAVFGGLLLGGEAVLAILIGRKVVRAGMGRNVRKVLPPVIFLAVYFVMNVLAALVFMRFGKI